MDSLWVSMTKNFYGLSLGYLVIGLVFNSSVPYHQGVAIILVASILATLLFGKSDGEGASKGLTDDGPSDKVIENEVAKKE
mgnify:CR=1 FL=1